MPTQTRFLLTSEAINGCRQFGIYSFAYKTPVCRIETDARMWATTKMTCRFFFCLCTRGEKSSWLQNRKQTAEQKNEQTKPSELYIHSTASRGERECLDAPKPRTKEEEGSAPHLAQCFRSDRLSWRQTGPEVSCFTTQPLGIDNERQSQVSKSHTDIFFVHIVVPLQQGAKILNIPLGCGPDKIKMF